jgi:phosphoribosylformylglycinamidine synthase
VLVADIPNRSLTDDAPLYHRPVGTWKAPVPLDPPAHVVELLTQPRDYTADLKKLLASANICDKRWVFEQYDSMVQTNTVQGPGSEAGVMRMKHTGHPAMHTTPAHTSMMPGTIGFTPFAEETSTVIEAAKPQRGIAMALAGNGRWCWLDPRLGAMHAVAEAARKVACTGATPVAATNCLNFGNPEKPEIMAQLSAAIDGIAEACTALDVPITGGNVSLYNETKGEGIYPTPVVGVVGLLDDVTKAVPSGFQREGDAIVTLYPGFTEDELTGETIAEEKDFSVSDAREFGSSEFAKQAFGSTWGTPPFLRLDQISNLNRLLSELAKRGLLLSAQDVSDGGRAVAFAKAVLSSGIGAEISEYTALRDKPPAADIFYESAPCVVVTCNRESVELIESIAEGFTYIADEIGTTGGEELKISRNDTLLIQSSVRELRAAYSSTLESQLAAEVVTA